MVLDNASRGAAIAIDGVSIVAFVVLEVLAVSTDLSASVCVGWSASSASIAVLNIAVGIAAITVYNVSIVTVVVAEIEAVTADLSTNVGSVLGAASAGVANF